MSSAQRSRETRRKEGAELWWQRQGRSPARRSAPDHRSAVHAKPGPAMWVRSSALTRAAHPKRERQAEEGAARPEVSALDLSDESIERGPAGVQADVNPWSVAAAAPPAPACAPGVPAQPSDTSSSAAAT